MTVYDLMLALMPKDVSPEDLIWMSIVSDISVLITSKRVELGMSKEEFADILGLTKRQLINI